MIAQVVELQVVLVDCPVAVVILLQDILVLLVCGFGRTASC